MNLKYEQASRGDDNTPSTQHTDRTSANARLAPIQGIIQGRQSNHGDYCLPSSVSQLNAIPLYLAVAHWACLLGTPVGREDISRAFRISERRAADVMSYIMHARTDLVSCIRHLHRSTGGVRTLRMEVTAVTDTAPIIRTAQPKPKKRRANAEKSKTVQTMKTWFLTGVNRSLSEA